MHQPVMLDEVMSSLNLKPGSCIVDATVGGGGHAKEVLERIQPGGRLIGIDVDERAIEIARDVLKNFAFTYVRRNSPSKAKGNFEGSFKLINDNFKNLDRILVKEEIESVDGFLFDLGLSSYQIEDKTRGFSIKHDSRLDMRMGLKLKLTAYDIVNKFREKDLSLILQNFGEERFHKRIVRFILSERSRKPIETTHELAALVRKAIGRRSSKRRINPATRTFQALRIAVNDELRSLEDGLKKAVSYLAAEGRICVISFHSLEDRIVKRLFRGYAELGVLKVLTKKPMTPSRKEILFNPRARSAKLRVAERLE